MSTDDFFDRIDGKLRKHEKAQEGAKKAAADNHVLLKDVVARLTPVVKDYESRLKQRGLNVEVQISDHRISFILRYKDGGYNGLVLGLNSSDRLEITNRFTNDDGKNYTGTSGLTYDRINWKDDIFVQQLQQCIDDFILFSERHGGI